MKWRSSGFRSISKPRCCTHSTITIFTQSLVDRHLPPLETRVSTSFDPYLSSLESIVVPVSGTSSCHKQQLPLTLVTHTLIWLTFLFSHHPLLTTLTIILPFPEFFDIIHLLWNLNYFTHLFLSPKTRRFTILNWWQTDCRKSPQFNYYGQSRNLMTLSRPISTTTKPHSSFITSNVPQKFKTYFYMDYFHQHPRGVQGGGRTQDWLLAFSESRNSRDTGSVHVQKGRPNF